MSSRATIFFRMRKWKALEIFFKKYFSFVNESNAYEKGYEIKAKVLCVKLLHLAFWTRIRIPIEILFQVFELARWAKKYQNCHLSIIRNKYLAIAPVLNFNC